jgi:hypothetical protein
MHMAQAKPDPLAFVASHRQPEVRRRITAIERHLADPKGYPVIRLAHDLGLSRTTTHGLVRVWRRDHDARTISGAGRTREYRTRLTDEQRALLARADAALPNGDLKSVIDEAQRIASITSVEMPGHGTARLELLRMRKGRIDNLDIEEGQLVVDFSALALPVDDGSGGAFMPVGAFIIDIGLRQVIGLALADSVDESEHLMARAILDGVERTGAKAFAAGTKVMVAQAAAFRADRLIAILTDASLNVAMPDKGNAKLGRVLKAVCGPEVANVSIRNGMTSRPPAWRKMNLQSGAGAITLRDAEALMKARLFGAEIQSVLARQYDPLIDELAGRLAKLAG